jgi:hypothetical protein
MMMVVGDNNDDGGDKQDILAYIVFRAAVIE